MELPPKLSNERIKKCLTLKCYTSCSEAGVKTLVCSSKNHTSDPPKKGSSIILLRIGILRIPNLEMANLFVKMEFGTGIYSNLPLFFDF